MAEKLSQSQIDALLNAVRSGEKDLSESSEKSSETKYRKYDFSSPRKFTKDRIKMLNSVYENYARIINTRLNGWLRTNCEITVESVEEQHYYEFSNALSEGDVLGMADVVYKGKTHEIPVMIYLGTAAALSMMDRLMGGEGDLEDMQLTDYSFTDLELRLYEDIATELVSVMGGGWENYTSIDFRYNRTDVNPTMNQVMGLDEIVMIIDMKLKFPNVTGRMSICLPGEMLSTVFGEISRENPTRRVGGEDKSEEILENLRDTELQISAQLGQTQLSLRDVYHLNVGDVIDIGIVKDSEIYLEIGGYKWFAGHLGTFHKNLAVKIDSICYQEE